MFRRAFSSIITKTGTQIKDAITTQSAQEWRLLSTELRTSTNNTAAGVCRRTFANETSTSSSAVPQKQGLASVPGIMKVLGFGGALPFWMFSPPIAKHVPLDLLDPKLIQHASSLQLGYGATIISFLGGVHWGLAMTNVGGVLGAQLASQRYAWSVLPCLLAWPTLVMAPTQAAGIQAVLLGAVFAVDRVWASKGLLPPYYMALRLPLTLLAASGLAMTAVSAGSS